ncbi:hypothetical protein AYO20_07438 [Fonsecaea nubica]|uniref:Uncharacterized protein n=1 Tax=Fonsecaea nubica TaxID=856822 RepID=A0A178CUZ7_9EURO|nr:hypothetical protein AYO20_07438 [Fonsecaea nubica]OAL33276.1 hypothetical protein AYO20_07438 [Fonsecaea nubica]
MNPFFPNDVGSLQDEPILEVYARPQGNRGLRPLPVVHDENASCCTITSALYNTYRLDLTSYPPEDDYSCHHASHSARVGLYLNRGMITYPVTFCVLEGSEMVAVMTGKESCWSKQVTGNRIAAIVSLRSKEELEELERKQAADFEIMLRECEEESQRYAAEFRAMDERDATFQRQRQQAQQAQAQQAQQAQAQQAQAQQAQAQQAQAQQAQAQQAQAQQAQAHQRAQQTAHRDGGDNC